MDFECLSVGNVYDEIIGEPDTIRFDINDNGGVLLVLYNNPTDHEISQFSSGADFEVRFTVDGNRLTVCGLTHRRS